MKVFCLISWRSWKIKTESRIHNNISATWNNLRVISNFSILRDPFIGLHSELAVKGINIKLLV